MQFSLKFSTEARNDLQNLNKDGTTLKRVMRCLGQIQVNPRHPGLNSHKMKSMTGPDGADVWESYVANNSPAAWRVFWSYGPESGQITILSITSHP